MRQSHRPWVKLISFLLASAGILGAATVPTFQYATANSSYTLVGGDPKQGGTTTIGTVVVPITLSFAANKVDGERAQMDAAPDLAQVLRSPLFTNVPFPDGDTTQYADAMLRATFPKAKNWHTILAKPEVMKAISITVPAGFGYVLRSKKSGRSLAIADIEYVQRELFKQLPKQEGSLVIAVTHNTAYYTEGDATLCCSWGTHGSDSATGNLFVLGSYLNAAPAVVEDRDVQPLTEQLAEFINDPLHDPLVREPNSRMSGNRFPPWMRPPTMRPGDQGRCGGTSVASAYFLLEPPDTNRKNNFPESKPFAVHAGTAIYHLQNVALLPWYLGASGDFGSIDSFPEAQALSAPAQTCSARNTLVSVAESATAEPTVSAVPLSGPPNGHHLIGYWTGRGIAGAPFPLHKMSPQWDVIIVAFASPAKNAPEGTLRFQVPTGLDAEQFKGDIARLKSQGKKVMISLGGGGEFFTLNDPNRIADFVSCVSQMVREYGFDGIDIDFESPSLNIEAGDTDFKHPTTPSIVNLISGLRQLRQSFGAGFMISLVPEGTQIAAGYRSYGGQFGSYLPIAYGIRDILSFMDVQDYNTPPMEGLDGEIYQAGSVDYHAAVTELVLHGFHVGGDPKQFFPPLPADHVAVGFLTGETSPLVVDQSMAYIINGKMPVGAKYRLRDPRGYPGMIGAMFWTIDDDRREGYRFSNVIGPELHGFSEGK